MLKYFLALATVLFIASCASLTEDECRAGNWESIGFVDGTNGQFQSYISKHGEACTDYGVVPDTAAWLKGRLEGLKTYCTPQNVYEVGRHGTEMNPVCSPEQTAELRLANFYGLRYFEITRWINDLEAERNDLTHLLATDFEGELTAEQIQLRRFYRTELLNLKKEILDLRRDVIKYDALP